MIAMNYCMFIVVLLFTILTLYDLWRFVRKKESVKVLIVFIIIMVSSLIIGVLLATGRRPASPSELIDRLLKMMGVIK